MLESIDYDFHTVRSFVSYFIYQVTLEMAACKLILRKMVCGDMVWR